MRQRRSKQILHGVTFARIDLKRIDLTIAAMPIVTFSDFEKYGKAIALLLRRGCMIEARDGQKLVVTIPQEELLIAAGLVDNRAETDGKTKRGKAQEKP